MRALAAAGLGFLLAVLWFDLMFDVQARGRDGGLVGVLVRSELPTWRAIVALVLAVGAIGLAGARTVRNAKLCATAARTSAVNAFAPSFWPSRMSIARRVFPSRLELNKSAG